MVHTVLHRHAPAARVVDLTHGIAAHDVRAGAFTLWRSVPWIVPHAAPPEAEMTGVILAVVDPGVGTARRPVALRAGPALLVGPDNGLLLPAAARLGGPSEVVELDRARITPLEAAGGATFDGRDLFAPAAGALAAGAALTDVGWPIGANSLVALDIPEPVTETGDDGRPAVRAEVLWVDTFGNAQLNLTAPDLDRLAPPAGRPVRIAIEPAQDLTARVVGSYGDIAPDRFALVVDSYGLLSVCADRHPAAAALGLTPGRVIRLCRDDWDHR